jgi:hypothetical protein
MGEDNHKGYQASRWDPPTVLCIPLKCFFRVGSIHRPLVLLTISDYITRHTLRQQKGAIVGALLGQQNGREITVEHAFECRVMGGGSPSLDEEWFTVRLQQSELFQLYYSLG